MTGLRQITEQGQAVWIDDLNRELLNDGDLERLIADDGLSGVASNPTTFEKAMAPLTRRRSTQRITSDVPVRSRLRASTARRAPG
jgi:transaldolase/glucose-6-phosphate isomerase